MVRPLAGAGILALALHSLPTEPACAAPVTWAVNNHQYEAVLVPQGLSWFDAERAVEARGCGWYLATLTWQDEDKFVFSLIKNNRSFFVGGNGPWLGAYQTSSSVEPAGNWAWVTGEAFTYTNWARGEPSNFTAGHQDVEPGVPKGQIEAFLSHKLNGQWNDHHPEALFHGYVAEFDTATQAACESR